MLPACGRGGLCVFELTALCDRRHMVSCMAREVPREGSSVGEAALRILPGDQAQGRATRHLQPAAEA